MVQFCHSDTCCGKRAQFLSLHQLRWSVQPRLVNLTLLTTQIVLTQLIGNGGCFNKDNKPETDRSIPLSISLLSPGYLCGLCCLFVLPHVHAFIKCFGIHWYGKKIFLPARPFFQILQEEETSSGEQM